MKKWIGICLVPLCGACAAETQETQEAQTAAEGGVTFTDEATGASISAIETLSFEGDVKVGFFEPAPGELFVGSWGPNGAPPAISKELAQEDLLPLELYERLSGTSAPASLVAAQSRALDAEAASGETRGDTRVQTVAPVQTEEGDAVRAKSSEAGLFDCKGAFSYDEWFYCTHCSDDSDIWRTWMWSTGNGSLYEEDVTTYWSTVSVYGGNVLNFQVRRRPWFSWVSKTDINIAPGFYFTSSHRDPATDYDIEAKTRNATNSTYHWCTYGNT